MPSIKITREPLPEAPEKVVLYTNDGGSLGILRFATKSGTTTSVLEYSPHQQPHRHYPLRAKYRPR